MSKKKTLEGKLIKTFEKKLIKKKNQMINLKQSYIALKEKREAGKALMNEHNRIQAGYESTNKI